MKRTIRNFHWGEIPFFFITIPLAISILLAYSYPQNTFSLPILFSLALLPLTLFLLPISPFHFLYPIRNTISPLFSLTALFFIWNLSQQTWRKFPSKSGYSHRLTITEVKKKSSIARFADGEPIFLRTCQFQPGDEIQVEGMLRRIYPQPSQKIGDFNFYTYATRRNIRYSLIPQRVALLGRASWYFVPLHALRWRDEMGKSLTQNTRYGGWVKAILFGDDRSLEGDALEVFQQTGTLHVLAVSGMHVSVLFWVVENLLKRLPGFRRWPWARFFAGNSTLWVYAFVSGFSPSIARSAWMFTLGSLGKLIHREGVALNHLLASACFILWANPSNLFHLGFQLSFVAVASILLFEPLFTSWMSWNSWIGKKLGAAMGVSTAAQIGTAPLGLFYFQSFPLLFLPANLIAVPLSSLLLLLYLLLLPLHPFLSHSLIIFLIDQPIHFFLKIMSIFESFPISIWQQSITWEQVCLLIAALVQFRISVIFSTRLNWAILSFLLVLGMLWPNLKN